MASGYSSRGTSRRRGTSGGPSGNLNRSSINSIVDDDDEEERINYIPPRLDNLHLTVNWPLQCPVKCLIGNCKVRMKGDTWTSVINSLKRHMKQIHKVVPTDRTNWCTICHSVIGRMPATHACFRNRKMFVLKEDDCPFICDICRGAYPTYRGLSNHKLTHKKANIQQTYNKRKGLPVTPVRFLVLAALVNLLVLLIRMIVVRSVLVLKLLMRI